MKIFLFSYWSIHDGITQGTIFPLIDQISNDPRIEAIYYCTIEHRKVNVPPIDIKKTVHLPIQFSTNWLSKACSVVRLPFVLRRAIKQNGIDLIWCKGASAGAIGVLTHWLSGVRFVVDSFEPHAEYMAQSRTWSRISPKYLIQRWLEKQTMLRALALLPVSDNYRNELCKKGVSNERMFVAPCVVDPGKFNFNKTDRHRIREQLIVEESTTIGIYVGKFGGLYYYDEAFKLYKRLFDFFDSQFFLILITEMDSTSIQTGIRKYGLPLHRIHFSRVSHNEVSKFLSAADFGISTIKSVPAMQYCSPIKHGEYWAADLPILSTLLFGDDAEIIDREAGGVLVNASEGDWERKFIQLKTLLATRGTGHYSNLARTYRNPSMLRDAVEFVLNKSVTIGKLTD